jgi:hypothetical protein
MSIRTGIRKIACRARAPDAFESRVWPVGAPEQTVDAEFANKRGPIAHGSG